MRFAVRHDLLVAVRGGGHSIPGRSVCDGGLVVDLSPMKAIDVDPVGTRGARAAGRACWREFDARHPGSTAWPRPAGRSRTPASPGSPSAAGSAGSPGCYGLACDNLVEAEVVTADGEVPPGSTTRDPDLLWGLRGGGGNFGVVTRFTFALHPVAADARRDGVLPAATGAARRCACTASSARRPPTSCR